MKSFVRNTIVAAAFLIPAVASAQYARVMVGPNVYDEYVNGQAVGRVDVSAINTGWISVYPYANNPYQKVFGYYQNQPKTVYVQLPNRQWMLATTYVAQLAQLRQLQALLQAKLAAAQAQQGNISIAGSGVDVRGAGAFNSAINRYPLGGVTNNAGSNAWVQPDCRVLPGQGCGRYDTTPYGIRSTYGDPNLVNRPRSR